MSGARLLLDTNAVVSLLCGAGDVPKLVSQAAWIGISVVSRLEFLAFPRLGPEDAALFERFCERVETIGLTKDDTELLETAVRLRREHGLKLPDAVIAATAIVRHAELVTADSDFDGVAGLAVVHLAPA